MARSRLVSSALAVFMAGALAHPVGAAASTNPRGAASEDEGTAQLRPRTTRVSQTSDGLATPFSSRPAISGDGRYVAFDSDSPLLGSPRGGRLAVFVADVRTGAIVDVSISGSGRPANGSTFYAALSRTGRFVAYKSYASNLVAGDSNGSGDFFVHDRDLDSDGVYDEPGAISTELVTVATDGTQAGSGDSHRVMGRPSLSADGRYAVFASRSDALVAGDTNGASDVFVRDRLARTTERVSVTADGDQADRHSFAAGGDACLSCDPDDGPNGSAISQDGRFVTFTSTATNLVQSDTNDLHDVFVRDREAGTTVRVSVATDGTQMQGRQSVGGASLSSGSGAVDSMISGDGRYVTFQSNSQGLVPVDQLQKNRTLDYDIFVHDRDADSDGVFDESGGIATRRVNVSSTGAETDDPDSRRAVISPDGRHIAFFSLASNLVAGDTNACGFSAATKCWDVFVHDIPLGWTDRVSVAYNGTEGNELSLWPSISDDGRYVSFMSFAKNLLEKAEPLTLTALVFLRDRGPRAGVGEATAVVDPQSRTVTASGWTSFHGARLASQTDPSDDVDPLAEASGGDVIGAGVAYRPALDDVLMQVELSHLPVDSSYVVPVGGSGPTFYGFEFSVQGRDYQVRATAPQYQTADGMPRNTNHWSEELAAETLATTAPGFELYECRVLCERTAILEGSYGTTGNEVWVSVPLPEIGAHEGADLAGMKAFASIGGMVGRDEVLLGDVRVPARRFQVELAPAGAPEAEVEFRDSTDSVDVDGVFAVTRDLSNLDPGSYRLWTRACLGSECGVRSAPFTVAAETVPPTHLSFIEGSDVVGQFSDTASVAARLVDPAGAPVPGADLTFELIGADLVDRFAATTDDDGTAGAELAMTVPPGEYVLRVFYPGDDAVHGPSETEVPFLILKEDTSLAVLIEGRGMNQQLQARLSDRDDGTGLPGRGLTFFADGTEIGVSTTTEDGVALLQVPPRYRGGQHVFGASFPGDDLYESSAGELRP